MLLLGRFAKQKQEKYNDFSFFSRIGFVHDHLHIACSQWRLVHRGHRGRAPLKIRLNNISKEKPYIKYQNVYMRAKITVNRKTTRNIFKYFLKSLKNDPEGPTFWPIYSYIFTSKANQLTRRAL